VRHNPHLYPFGDLRMGFYGYAAMWRCAYSPPSAYHNMTMNRDQVSTSEDYLSANSPNLSLEQICGTNHYITFGRAMLRNWKDSPLICAIASRFSLETLQQPPTLRSFREEHC